MKHKLSDPQRKLLDEIQAQGGYPVNVTYWPRFHATTRRGWGTNKRQTFHALTRHGYLRETAGSSYLERWYEVVDA